MKLGEFNEQRARHEAISFLSKSISVLCQILGINSNDFDETAQNPHEQSSPFHNSYNVLVAEVKALKKILHDDER